MVETSNEVDAEFERVGYESGWRVSGVARNLWRGEALCQNSKTEFSES